MVALVNPAAPGNCDNGVWRIGFTFVTPEGETELGPLSDPITVTDKAVNGQLYVTGVAIGGGAVMARKGYAEPPFGGPAKYFATIADNTTEFLVVNISASSLGAESPTTNTTHDPEFARLIPAARDRGELRTNRAFVTQTWDWYLDGFPGCGWLEIPKPPLQSVTSVTYRDLSGVLQTWDPANYVVDAPAGPRSARGRLSLASGATWPSTFGQASDIVIRFVAGYGAPSAVPAILRTAIAMDVVSMYLHREGGFVSSHASVASMAPGASDIYRSFHSAPTQRLRRPR